MKEKVYDYLKKNPRPVHPKDIARVFGIKRGEAREILKELLAEGKLERFRNRYQLPSRGETITGRLDLAKDGYGFVVPEDGGPDLFIPEARLKGAWHGDRVEARVVGTDKKGRPSGEVVRIKERARRTAVGRLEFSRGYAWLVPEDPRLPPRIKLAPEGLSLLKPGSRIAARLKYPEETGEREVYGVFLEELKEGDDVEAETRAVILKYDLKDEFPKEALVEAERAARAPMEPEVARREDFRDLPVFTLDGPDAKDFDDALHVRRLPDGTYEVGVHIADVSHYVKEGSSLDREAYERGTSVYLPGRVLPMLPEVISNGVASLVPGEDRLVLSVIARLDEEGRVLSHRFAEGVIRSKARLTYPEVEAFLRGEKSGEEWGEVAEGVKTLSLLAEKLKKKREAEGAISFDFPEVKVELGERGEVHLIPLKEERARSLVEEFMLLANRLVAEELSERGLPALYRVHEDPSEDRFRELSEALSRLGYDLREPTPAAYQKVLERAKGRPEEAVVATLLLRSLKLARYAEENLGHFGLAFRDYLHFTSPIRRYPDLVVHRVVKSLLKGRLTDEKLHRWQRSFPHIAEHASVRERLAEEAERDLAKFHHARWAKERLGEVFSGTVSGVQNFGYFVALDNGVEGLVRREGMSYDPETLVLEDERTGKKIRLGDRVRVQIVAANPALRRIDLEPVEEVGELTKKEGEKRRKRRVVGPPEGKDRPERPVKLTVNRVYYGEWQGEREESGKKRR